MHLVNIKIYIFIIKLIHKILLMLLQIFPTYKYVYMCLYTTKVGTLQRILTRVSFKNTHTHTFTSRERSKFPSTLFT